MYKRQIYQIAESNRIEKIDSVAKIESKLFLPELECSTEDWVCASIHSNIFRDFLLGEFTQYLAFFVTDAAWNFVVLWMRTDTLGVVA